MDDGKEKLASMRAEDLLKQIIYVNDKTNNVRVVSNIKTGIVVITYQEQKELNGKIVYDHKVLKILGLLLDSVSILIPTHQINPNEENETDKIINNPCLNVKYFTTVKELKADFSKVYYYELFEGLKWGIFFMKDQIGEYYYQILQQEKSFYKMSILPPEFRDIGVNQNFVFLILYCKPKDEKEEDIKIYEINVERRFYASPNEKDLLVLIPSSIKEDGNPMDLVNRVIGGFLYYHDGQVAGVFDRFLKYEKEEDMQKDLESSLTKYFEDLKESIKAIKVSVNSEKEKELNLEFVNSLISVRKESFFFANIKLFSENVTQKNDNDLLRSTGVINAYKNILYSSIGVFTFSKETIVLLRDFVSTRMKYLSLVINHGILKKASLKKKINLKKHSQNLLIKRLLIENVSVLNEEGNNSIELTDFGLKEKNIKMFLEALYSSNFEYFDFSGNWVRNKAMDALTDFLFFNHAIKSLILRGVPMEKDDFRKICQFLHLNKSLKTFHISGENFTSRKVKGKVSIRVEEENIDCCIEDIVKSKSLVNLYLHDLGLTDFEFQKVFEKMSLILNPPVKEEKVKEKKKEGVGFGNLIAKHAADNKNKKEVKEQRNLLEILSLSGNSLTPASSLNTTCITSFKKFITNCKLRVLNLSKCNLNDPAVVVLFEGINNPDFYNTLRSIDLSDNKFADKGAKSIGNFLEGLCNSAKNDPNYKNAELMQSLTEQDPSSDVSVELKLNQMDKAFAFKGETANARKKSELIGPNSRQDFYLYLKNNKFSQTSAIGSICTGISFCTLYFFHLYLDNTISNENRQKKNSLNSLDPILNKIKETPRSPLKTLSLTNNGLKDSDFDQFKSYFESRSKDRSKNPYDNFDLYIYLYNNNIPTEAYLSALYNKNQRDLKLKLMVDYFDFRSIEESISKRRYDMKNDFRLELLIEKTEYLENCFCFLDLYHKKESSCKKKDNKRRKEQMGMKGNK